MMPIEISDCSSLASTISVYTAISDRLAQHIAPHGKAPPGLHLFGKVAPHVREEAPLG
jgi:hypothetical protein